MGRIFVGRIRFRRLGFVGRIKVVRVGRKVEDKDTQKR